ncbi:hypothetical protein HBI56_231210 [Parastagonospora nodorum]|uniref:C2H2-type domain-containing protein n=2 Tax=Phaeosphaeria nodorum (strain SN15 / ATCC MYA-4574 / FGSC 10173) TaxID=321614 RepID=A0A7U2I5N5_PHANO|nr:hypothetical protein SNOG_16159 [Parastagonospora nodorum SN15]KAH3905124.1 hypothetical protein HBH56_224150 [Parastagonospora nodorum]EAT76531.1 hypothetical protein SNOG_16159 [Parastagonospora nodorum SN15]KAH3921968.1 hypothetical protein HBH54_232300 [Parastagonospora nodorum]KAH3959933.1 hypothetical protein HBH52_240490 [Parastagonospora nodorum]KAH3991688.1 hypothetical protein HBI10_228570 [Parastagonospora nodorum]
MEQHRDAPAHMEMFSCAVCTRFFGDRKALAQHEASPPHVKMVAANRSAPLVGAVQPTHPPVPAMGENSSDFIAFEDEDARDDYEHEFNMRDTHTVSNFSDDDQDWVLCDKDCGWCGHCGDAVDY